jgi:hypothetical protein
MDREGEIVIEDLMNEMTFPEAMEQVIAGKRIARLAWQDVAPEDYCMLRGGFLSIYRDRKWHRWLVNDGDLLADDWLVLEMVRQSD